MEDRSAPPGAEGTAELVRKDVAGNSALFALRGWTYAAVVSILFHGLIIIEGPLGVTPEQTEITTSRFHQQSREHVVITLIYARTGSWLKNHAWAGWIVVITIIIFQFVLCHVPRSVRAVAISFVSQMLLYIASWFFFGLWIYETSAILNVLR